MKRLETAVRLESFGLPLRKAIDEAARLGSGGVVFDAVGDLSPARLSDSGRRELRHLLRSRNLELAALGCPLRHSLDTAENQQPRLDQVRQIMSLAWELGPRLVLAAAGPLPAEEDAERAARMRESLLDLGAYGDRVGTRLALETGLESGEAMAAWLASLPQGTVGADLVPGNLLQHGFAPEKAARDLAGRIFNVTARDVRRVSAGRAAQPVPLGAGDIDWLSMLGTLEAVEYRGRVVVPDGAEAGLAFLKRLGVGA
ncbi:MAG: sugar phosphate isomerase/epimerase [Gemmataceae bacterium]|nr:sugar phosphate isomerase/epimerase [Gemmataceae bacterium]